MDREASASVAAVVVDHSDVANILENVTELVRAAAFKERMLSIQLEFL